MTTLILFRGLQCHVLREESGKFLVEGPRGQEWAERRPMTRVRVHASKNVESMLRMLGELVEYEGVTMLVANVEPDGDGGLFATLHQQPNDGLAELPLPFERFMADHGCRVIEIGSWGHLFLPSAGPT